MEKQKRVNTQTITAVALMTALVFISNFLQISVPTGLPADTRLHLGNVMCLLAALLFGKTKGGLAAGLGSFLFDLTNPMYIATCWVTFIMKFAMAFICGLIVHGGSKKDGKIPPVRAISGAACGALSYVALYLAKNYIENHLVLGIELEVVYTAMVTKGTVSLVNAAIAVIVSLLLSAALRPALKRTGFSEKAGVL